MTERLIRRKGIPAPSRAQMREIKRIMLWPRDKRFPRCPGKNKKFLKEHEEAGDFSHSDSQHLCDECRCKQRAGQNTRGDFYGLGIETGHLGVGWCKHHEINHPNRMALAFADKQLRLIQQVGDLQMDSDSHVKNAEMEAKTAEMSLRARQDLELVVETLNDFKRDLNMLDTQENEAIPLLKEINMKLQFRNIEEPLVKAEVIELKELLTKALLERECLTELCGGNLIEMTDATKIKLKLDIAKALSRVKLDHFKLDSTSYIHYDELKVRIPRMLNLASNLFEELREMVMAKEENAVERINEKWVIGLTAIWSDVQTGAQS